MSGQDNIASVTVEYPQAVNLDGDGQATRGPQASVTKAVTDPHLPLTPVTLEDLPSVGGPATDAGHSQTTTETSATGPSAVAGGVGFNNGLGGAHNGLTRPAVRGLDLGAVSRGLGATVGSGMSVSNIDALDNKVDLSSYTSSKVPSLEQAVSNVGDWAQQELEHLGKE